MITNESKEIDIYSVFYNEDKNDVDAVISIIPKFNHNERTNFYESISLGGIDILVYKRTYFLDKDITNYNKLTKKQKLIFDCINTTQSNGYEREKSLLKIIKYQEPYIPYFVLRLLGDFVTPIQKSILEQIEYLKTDTYKKFILENEAFYNKIKSRVESYWGEYRMFDFPKTLPKNIKGETKQDYPGILITKELNKLLK